jgi:hypothetical protein
VSNDGDASRRLSDALDQIFSGSGAATSSRHEPADATPDEPYELPEIVPATEEPPAAAEPPAPADPSLPPRATVPEPDVVRRPDATVATPAVARTPAATTPVARPTAATPAAAPAPTTSWADHVTSVPASARNSGLRAPGRKPRVRRVTRVLRHIDPWSTFKVALLFSLVTYLVALTSGVLLWRVADSTGTLDNVERWFTQFGWETFELQGGEIFQNAWIIGLFGVVAMTGGLVLLATVFNLVSDIIGGVRVTVLEEEVVERTVSSTRRYVVRQGPASTGSVTAAAQEWDVDDEPATAAEPAETASARSERTTAQPVVATPSADWSVDD